MTVHTSIASGKRTVPSRADDLYKRLIESRIDEINASVTGRADLDSYHNFLSLKGGFLRPHDVEPMACGSVAFAEKLKMVPTRFLESFDRVMTALGERPLRIAPDIESIRSFNPDPRRNLAKELAKQCKEKLNSLNMPLLIALQRSYRELCCEHMRPPENWSPNDAQRLCIVVPGARTMERPATAFYEFTHTAGRAPVILSGLRPYWAKEQDESKPSEAAGYAAFLRLLGVPSEMVITEERARDTGENARNTAEIINLIGKSIVLIVTSPYHICRAAFNLRLELQLLGIGEIYALPCYSAYNTMTLARANAPDDNKDPLLEFLQAIFNEYLKIAHDLCTAPRTDIDKITSGRAL